MERRMPVFADRFIELRGKRTQDEFAKFLGISRPTVGFYESGQRIPDAVVLRQIAEKCNVSTDYLLGLTDEKTLDQNIQAICKKTGLTEKAVTQIILAKESELNCDGSYFELWNKSIESYAPEGYAPEPQYGDSFLSDLLERLFDYKNALEATHALSKLNALLSDEEWKKLREDSDESAIEEAYQNIQQRYVVESQKLENDTQYPKYVRKMISMQNHIDNYLSSEFEFGIIPYYIRINDIYRNRVIQCITDELSCYEQLYKENAK